VPTSPEPHPFLDKDRRKIRALFDRIAPRYDLLNHLFSVNLDRRWRKKAAAELVALGSGNYLDACAGTGDLSFALTHRLGDTANTRVYSSDFSLSMLVRGKTKIRPSRGETPPRFLAGDTLRLPFADGTFEGAAVAFGIRNVEDLPGGLRELTRVLRPGGRLLILEFTPFRFVPLRPFFDFYTRVVLPRVGNWISRSRERAYTYLQESVERWPQGEELAESMRAAGLTDVRWRTLFPGNVAIHAGSRT
jgi:demethylmenaquinone methyltransferase/2-methoxy-6-polyprenyl-1,4-benzoquinol methylase